MRSAGVREYSHAMIAAGNWPSSTAGSRAENPDLLNIFPQKNGSKAWAFDLVGIYDGKDEDWKKRTNVAFISHDYFDEATNSA